MVDIPEFPELNLDIDLPVSPVVLVSAAVGVVTLLVVLCVALCKRASKGSTVLIAGLMDSGKTVLFFQLWKNEFRDTVTSMKENIESFTPAELTSNKPALRFVDFPGHGSLRAKLPSYFPDTRAVLFVIDAVETKQLPRVADYLFDILAHPDIARKRNMPVFIACNKSDMQTCKSPEHIREKLEHELNKIREVRAHTDVDTNSEVSHKLTLGKEGHPFTFSESKFDVTIEAISARKGELAPVYEWCKTIGC